MVLVEQPDGKRRWEDIGVDLYTFMLPNSRVLRASTHAVQVNCIL
jgi:chloramphenicol 3-O-phosphotransferase